MEMELRRLARHNSRQDLSRSEFNNSFTVTYTIDAVAKDVTR